MIYNFFYFLCRVFLIIYLLLVFASFLILNELYKQAVRGMKSYFFLTRSRVPPQLMPLAPGAVIKTEHGVCLRKPTPSAAHVKIYVCVREIILPRRKQTLYFYATASEYITDKLHEVETFPTSLSFYVQLINSPQFKEPEGLVPSLREAPQFLSLKHLILAHTLLIPFT